MEQYANTKAGGGQLVWTDQVLLELTLQCQWEASAVSLGRAFCPIVR